LTDEPKRWDKDEIIRAVAKTHIEHYGDDVGDRLRFMAILLNKFLPE